MKLNVDLTVYKRRVGLTLEKITIRLGSTSSLALTYIPPSTINFSKFKRTSERIIKELNHGANNLRIESEIDTLISSFYYHEYHHVCWIESGDLMKVNMRRDLKNIVKGEIERRITKEYIHKPSKEKSQMEYRKRAYRGKCKK